MPVKGVGSRGRCGVNWRRKAGLFGKTGGESARATAVKGQEGGRGEVGGGGGGGQRGREGGTGLAGTKAVTKVLTVCDTSWLSALATRKSETAMSTPPIITSP